MSIQPVNANGTYLPAAQATQVSGVETGQTVKESSQKSRQDTVSIVNGDSGKEVLHAIRNDKAMLNDVAKIIQKVDATMGLIGKNLDAMKEDVATIVKNFPPFPPGDAERVRLLKSFNSLRQQIDSLTIPHPPEDAGYQRIIADPAVVSKAGGISLTLDTASVTVTLAPQEVHSGPTGLNIPPLPDSPPDEATDPQVKQALDNMDTAKATLKERQAALAANAEVISSQIGKLPIFKKIFNEESSPVGPEIAQGKETGKNTDYSALATHGITGKSTQQIQSTLT